MTVSRMLSNSADTMRTASMIAGLISPGSRARKYTTVGLATVAAFSAIHELVKTWDNRTEWTIHVPTNSWAFAQVARWIHAQHSSGPPTAVKLTDRGENLAVEATITNDTSFRLGRATVNVEIDVPRGVRSQRHRSRDTAKTVVLTTYSHTAYRRMLDVFANMTPEPDRERNLYLQTDYDEWFSARALPNRPLDSVVLTRGQNERIVADIERFLASRDAYTSMGVPWHRGYLFSGVPGTGKSSYATALAAHFDRDVYFLSLSNIGKDGSLYQLANGIPKNAFLVVEDMDAAGVRGQDREDASGQIPSLSAVLNLLDGITTPDGLVTIITANDVSQFDAATLRPGRVDVHESFTYVDGEQLERMVARFAEGARVPLEIPAVLPTIAPVTIMEVFKRHFDEPNAAVTAINDLLKKPHSTSI